jgi:hypothetical protein
MAAGSTYSTIETKSITGNPTSVTFTSIPSTYTDLVVVISAALSSTNDIGIRFNGDTGTNYSRTILYGTGSAAGSVTGGGANQGQIEYYGTADTTLGNSVIILNVMNYSNTTTNKTVLCRSNNASLGVDAVVNLWRSTAAINQIEFKPYTGAMTWVTGSTFTLYGIAAA